MIFSYHNHAVLVYLTHINLNNRIFDNELRSAQKKVT